MEKNCLKKFVSFLKKNSPEGCRFDDAYVIEWDFVEKLFDVSIETGVDQLEAYLNLCWVARNAGTVREGMSHIFKHERKYVPSIEKLLFNEYIFKAKDLFDAEHIFEAARLLEKEGIKFTDDIKKQWFA